MLWTSFQCETTPGRALGDGVTEFRIQVPDGAAPGFGVVSVVAANGASNPQLVAWESRPVVHESGGTNRESAVRLTADAFIHGGLTAGRANWYRWEPGAGDAGMLEIVAGRIGSSADPFLEIWDARGRRLAAIEDSPGAGVDARWAVPTGFRGPCWVSVRDSEWAGGPAHRYALRVAHASWAGANGFVFRAPAVDPVQGALPENEPNDDRAKATPVPWGVGRIEGGFGKSGDRDVYAMEVAESRKYRFTGVTRSIGSGADLALVLRREDGTVAAETAGGQGDAVGFEADLVAGRRVWLEVTELTGNGGPGMDYRVEVGPPPGGAVSTESLSVNGAAGESVEIKVAISTVREFKGKVRFSVVGEPWELEAAELGSEAKEGVLKIRIPAAAEAGTVHPVRLAARWEGTGGWAGARVTTRPGIRKAWPGIVTPLESMDGWILVGVQQR